MGANRVPATPVRAAQPIESMILAADAICETHDPGKGHPEQRARYSAVRDALEWAGLFASATVIGPAALSHADLALTHTDRKSVV